MEYYLFNDEMQIGPYTEAQVQNLWKTGAVTSRALYWTEGLSDWQPLVNLCESDARKEPNTSSISERVRTEAESLERKLGDTFSVFTRFYPRINGSHARSTLDPGKVEVFLKNDELILKYKTGILFKSKHTVSLQKSIREVGRLPENFSKECWRSYIAKNSGGGNFLTSTVISTVVYATTKTAGIAGLYLHFIDNDEKLLQAVLLSDSTLINEIITRVGVSASIASDASS